QAAEADQDGQRGLKRTRQGLLVSLARSPQLNSHRLPDRDHLHAHLGLDAHLGSCHRRYVARMVDRPIGRPSLQLWQLIDCSAERRNIWPPALHARSFAALRMTGDGLSITTLRGNRFGDPCGACCRTPSAVRRTSSKGLRGVLVCPFVAQMGGDARRGQAAGALPDHIAEFGNRPDKALESLAGAESELANGRYNNAANRAYYACFQAAIAALQRAG